jgi:hypothetical protein
VHAHVFLGTRDGAARGGHLLAATVRPTLEVIVEESPSALRRRIDDATGLPLIDLDAESGRIPPVASGERRLDGDSTLRSQGRVGPAAARVPRPAGAPDRRSLRRSQ